MSGGQATSTPSGGGHPVRGPGPRDITAQTRTLAAAATAAAATATGAGPWDRAFDTFPRLRALRDARGATLSGGELQLLAIARALMGNVDLLLLDEPFEGLAPGIVEVVWNVLHAVKGETTILLVEQNADLALALCDRAYVINNGSIAWSGEARALHADQELRLRLLGV